MRDLPATPIETLLKVRDIAFECGIEYVYTGNVFGPGNNTYCPSCKMLLVNRSWHDVIENKIIDGACPKCSYKINIQ
jgi:pyruvate formate lyase activating enzyme